MNGPSIADINQRLAGRMLELTRALGLGDPSSRSRDAVRFRSKGSLSIKVSGPKCGAWYDFEAGFGGDSLGLIAHVNRYPMRDAFRWALDWLGEGGPPPSSQALRPPVAPQEAAQPVAAIADTGREWALRLVRQLWDHGQNPKETLAEAYLASRGLLLPDKAPIRFHPKVWRNSANGPHGPAMLALMTDPLSGRPCGLHVTYVRPDGSGKASGERQKIMLGQAGVIRLLPDAEVTLGLGLAEGIETALAVMQRAGWYPVWAASSSGAIRRFPVLPGLESLTIFADQDNPGMNAARECCQRWAAAGREAQLVAPPAGDWNDALPRKEQAA
jgi:putative DNA primase/helicase